MNENICRYLFGGWVGFLCFFFGGILLSDFQTQRLLGCAVESRTSGKRKRPEQYIFFFFFFLQKLFPCVMYPRNVTVFRRKIAEGDDDGTKSIAL